MDRYRFSFWDSLIASTALVAGCRYLLSEDFRDGQTIEDSLTMVDPFLHAPAALP